MRLYLALREGDGIKTPGSEGNLREQLVSCQDRPQSSGSRGFGSGGGCGLKSKAGQ